MKKGILILAVLLFLSCEVGAVQLNFKDSYLQHETAVGDFSTDILSPISREDIRVLKDDHIDVAAQYDVVRIGRKDYLWLVMPGNEGNYSVKVEGIVASVNGIPEIIDYQKDFVVGAGSVNYSIAPGAIFTSKDFKIAATVYGEEQTISTDFPSSRNLVIYPGTNYIDYSIAGLIGVQQGDLNIGAYKIPYYINGAEYICGDGRLDGPEVCDGENLNKTTCKKISSSYVGGELKCFSSCLKFDTGSCTLGTDKCDSDHFDLCVNSQNCTSAGGFWYNSTCNEYESGAVCDEQHVGLCVTQSTCTNADGYWYNASCHEDQQPVCGNGKVEKGEECDGKNLTSKDCDYFGYDGGTLSCVSSGEYSCSFNYSKCYVDTKQKAEFTFVPDRIKKTVLVDGDLHYTFEIKNIGSSELKDLSFDFNPAKFVISPASNFSIASNETKKFNITLNENWRGRPLKGVVVAYSGEVYEYLVLDFSFTTNSDEVSTEYTKGGNSNGQAYYCSELSGVACLSNEKCSGDIVNTIDLTNCCVGKCEAQSSGGFSWIGYLIAGIVLLGIAVIYLWFRKTGKTRNPLATRVSQIQRNLP